MDDTERPENTPCEPPADVQTALWDASSLALSIAAASTRAADELERTAALLPHRAAQITRKVAALRAFAARERQEAARLMRMADPDGPPCVSGRMTGAWARRTPTPCC